MRKLITTILAGLAMVAAVPSVAQAALSETFTPITRGSSLPWLGRTLSAIEDEQAPLFRVNWLAYGQVADNAFFDVDGIPIYIGSPEQLQKMGQGPLVNFMEDHCIVGIHSHMQIAEHPYGTPSWAHAQHNKIIVLTSAHWMLSPNWWEARLYRWWKPAGCQYRFSTKSDEITLSHEVLETMADRNASSLHPKTFWRINNIPVEVGDPVEHHGYYDSRYGAWLSDFVLPSYFTSGPGRWDAMGVLKGPWPAEG